MNKKISAPALISLKNALSKIYWYKRDLRSFLSYSLRNNAIISTIDWDGNKYEAVSQLIDRMNQRPDIYFDDLIDLFRNVYNFNDFSHFNKLPGNDGPIRKAEAEFAVSALRNNCGDFFEREQVKQQERAQKQAFEERQKHTQDYIKKIEEFKNRYYTLSKMTNAQKRGYEFETFLNDLFAFFDLSPRSSFKIDGEQIDGAFTHDSTDYLLEAKWQSKPIQRSEIDIFECKISRKLKTTLGLFVSMNGFEQSAMMLAGSGKAIILMDSQDLIQVLEQRISLPELILLKRRHAAETGEIMYRINL